MFIEFKILLYTNRNTCRKLSIQMQIPKCGLPKVIIRHNLGAISAAKSRLLLLGQCHCLHRSSAEPTMAAFFDYLNLPNSGETWPSIGPIPSRLSFLLWHQVLKVEVPESGSWTAHYWAICHFHHGKPF